MDRFETFVSLIFEINKNIQRIKEQEMQEFGLKASHTMCLYYLSHHREGLTPTMLTDLCCIDKAATSRTLKQLVEKGLVYSDIPREKRGYRNLYYLSGEGLKLAKSINQKIDQALDLGGLGISEEDRSNLYQSLKTINKNLDSYVE